MPWNLCGRPRSMRSSSVAPICEISYKAPGVEPSTLLRMSALLLYGDTERSAALRHEIPIPIGDPFLFAEVDGRTFVLTTHLERARLERALPDVELLDYFALGYKDLVAGGLSVAEASREVEARAVTQLGVEEAIVPGDFPLALGDRLREDGVVLTVDDAAVDLRRRSKSPVELDGIRIAQRAAEAGMAAASELLARAQAAPDGSLELDGKPLLAEDVRAALRAACAEHGAPSPPDVIVASVWQGEGHEPGTGPLPAGLPIHVDLWPRHEQSACWADMSRTFIVGDSAPEHADLISEQAELVRTALEQAKEAVRPGITGRELYDATCDLFESAGFATQRTASGDGGMEGFQHSLGHGVGLEVHEAPGLGLAGHDPLVVGDVVAIEPGLWNSRFGGLIFEDLVLVTENGSELLTRFPYDLTPPG
jgi:Xaa-Pro aminopeptidase